MDPRSSRALMEALSQAAASGRIAACHDLSEGGLAVAASEMAFAGGVGVSLDLDRVPRTQRIDREEVLLFSESAGRFLVEVAPEKEKAFLNILKGLPLARLGTTIANPVLRLTGLDSQILLEEPLGTLKASWEKTLPEAMG